jgi:hypothetical protein
MLLKRWGANRNSGWTAVINNKDFTTSWNKKESTVELTFKRVSDPSASGQYNFQAVLTLDEISKILTLLSDQALRHSPEAVTQKMTPSTRALLRLLVASGGIPFAPTQA